MNVSYQIKYITSWNILWFDSNLESHYRHYFSISALLFFHNLNIHFLVHFILIIICTNCFTGNFHELQGELHYSSFFSIVRLFTIRCKYLLCWWMNQNIFQLSAIIQDIYVSKNRMKMTNRALTFFGNIINPQLILIKLELNFAFGLELVAIPIYTQQTYNLPFWS